jgi:PAS domain S-box-containing protein
MTLATEHQLLTQLDALVVVVNAHGGVEFVNPASKKMLGYEPAELEGEGWWNLTRGSEEKFIDRDFIVQLLSDKKLFTPHSFERNIKTANGKTRCILWTVSVSEENTLTGIGIDISARKESEKQQAEKIKELQAKNTEVSESIRYAKRIQDAVLQDPEILKNYFADAFVLYKPRDVVSGDLFWYYKKGSKIIVAAIDCTGHGVPGALMSVIASGIFRDVITRKEKENPVDILHAVDRELAVVLSKEHGEDVALDGMDLSLVVVDTAANELEFAGAFRPLVRIRNNAAEEFAGSRFPIGFSESEKNFRSEKISLQKGDKFYLFSDGYQDQFGGEKGKKLNKKRFYELLQSSADMEMEEQKSFLEYALSNWKQEERQTDDILIVGLQF